MASSRTGKMQKLLSPPNPLKPFIYTHCCQAQLRVVKAGGKQTFTTWIKSPALPACIVVSSIAVYAPPWPLLRVKPAKPGFLCVSPRKHLITKALHWDSRSVYIVTTWATLVSVTKVTLDLNSSVNNPLPPLLCSFCCTPNSKWASKYLPVLTTRVLKYRRTAKQTRLSLIQGEV